VLFAVKGSVTNLGQSEFNNDVENFAYVEITEPSGRRVMIEKVVVANDVGAIFAMGVTGEFLRYPGSFRNLCREGFVRIHLSSARTLYRTDVTENLQNIPLARDVALAIRAKIKEATGLNASAGISCNKFLAKLASDHRKPNGQYVITPEMGPAFVEVLPVGKFRGIGPATSAKMNSLGLHTGLDMRKQKL
jgi:hypothetical protein